MTLSKRTRTSGLVIALLVVSLGVVLGPRERFDARWVEPAPSPDLDGWLAEREARVSDIRPGDEKGIVWADPQTRAPTPLSLVYLHGFSADRHEVEPVVTAVGAEFGANVFFTRLSGHGRDGAAMAEATVEAWMDDAAEAVAIGGRIGERVVIVGTSTGGTLATWAATRTEAAGRIAGLVLVSPNYQPYDRSSRLLLYPWGSVVARLVVGPERCFAPENEQQAMHWTTCYPTEALSTMMAFVEHVRTLDLSSIRTPTLVLYSPEDQVVDSEETRRVVAAMTGTHPQLRVIAQTTDPAHHVLAGDIMSPVSNDAVRALLSSFLRDLMLDGARASSAGAGS